MKISKNTYFSLALAIFHLGGCKHTDILSLVHFFYFFFIFKFLCFLLSHSSLFHQNFRTLFIKSSTRTELHYSFSRKATCFDVPLSIFRKRSGKRCSVVGLLCKAFHYKTYENVSIKIIWTQQSKNSFCIVQLLRSFRQTVWLWLPVGTTNCLPKDVQLRVKVLTKVGEKKSRLVSAT